MIVVGVAADAKYDSIDEAPRPFLYLPLAQNYTHPVNIIVRTAGDPRGTIEPLQHALRAAGVHTFARPATFDDWISLALFAQRAATACTGVLGMLGVALALAGLFAAVSYSVRERKKELGIRVALGAGQGNLLRLVLSETAAVAGAGIAIGVVLGIAATAGFRSLFYGIGIVEPAVLVPVSASMLAVCMAVAAISALPWLRVDPLETIRHA